MRSILTIGVLSLLLLWSCDNKPQTKHKEKHEEKHETTSDFKFKTEQFADLAVLRYQIPGWDALSLQQKKLAYFLSEAAYTGREIIIDQNYKHNLKIKRTIEAILKNNKEEESQDWKKLEEYIKRLWFSNGIHHHYSTDKFLPEFSKEFFAQQVEAVPQDKLPIAQGQEVEKFIEELTEIMFSTEVGAKRVNLAADADKVAESANNYYEGLTEKEVTDFYTSIIDKNDPTPISYGLNSKLAKVDNKPQEIVYKKGGMYSAAIEKVIYWLDKAKAVAETETQAKAIKKLIEFYETGDLKAFDEYSVLWVKDTEPVVDFTNGFIEVYGDPLGYRGAWQSMVYIKDLEITKIFGVLGKEAGWFEKHSPIKDEHKRENPGGISYKVINVVAEAGDVSPTTPIGVNLPNANWIRAQHGSKAVSIGNIEHAYEMGYKSSGTLQEFYLPEQQEYLKKYGNIAGKLSTGLHEVIGHASGKLMAGVGTPKETLKNYASTLEETRADLVALYYIGDKHLVDMGLSESTDVMKAEYDGFMVNGLMRQLARIKPGKDIEEAHMRNRQLIASWAYEKGKEEKIVEMTQVEGKTYIKINDYDKLRTLFGQLLQEIQRIKSEGDFEAGKKMVETYGVKVDQKIHAEVLKRYEKLNVAPYGGFINPRLVPVTKNDSIIDIKVEYPEDFTQQMLDYSEKYALLPTEN